ncbi:hypothetical protein C6503_10370 [Candidatus Poribacteria bacterium]|nr:MAG: hypothetical protein C6503_10370 [Candidatus Poribacteria bacterium]
MRIQKHTSRALLLSLCVHIALMFVVSVFLAHHFDTERQHISAEILETVPEKQVRRRILHRHVRPNRQMANAGASDTSLPSSTYALRASVPKALIRDDVFTDIVTYTDLPQIDAPSPVSNISFGNDISRGLGIFDTGAMPRHGLIGEVFVFGHPISRMPNFDRLLSVNTFITKNLNVPTRGYIIGFPMPDMPSVFENFAIRFRAELKIDTPGIYTFELSSDDGSQLYINGKLVIDNDGIHATVSKQGSIKLDIGIHPIEIHYFQGPRYRIALQWFYQRPNSPRKIVVPPDVIYLPSEP